MKRLLSSVLFSAVIYYIPILGKTQFLFDYHLGVPFFLSVLIFFTQPVLKVSDALKEKQEDRLTVFIILLTAMLGLVIAVCEWAYFSSLPAQFNLSSVIGLVMMLFGFGFRLWAILTLGKYFTATVKVQEDQPIITQGPYARLRHPSYLGAYIFMLGVCVWLNSFFAFFLIGVGMFWAYRKRILAEESFLMRNFGDIYQAYQKHTSRLFHGIW